MNTSAPLHSPDNVNTDVEQYLARHPLTGRCPYEKATHRSEKHLVELEEYQPKWLAANYWRVVCHTCGAASPIETTYQDAIHVFNDDDRTMPTWTLGRSVNGFTLADGQEWHRPDWTQDMLPEGWRPLLLGEIDQSNDEISRYGSRFERLDNNCAWHCPTVETTCHCRTRRPLPVVDKWAAEKAAFAEGRRVEWKYVGANSLWTGCSKIVDDDAYEYRIADPYAELKAAHARGENIQFLWDGDWGDTSKEGIFSWEYPVDHYRIKPAPVMVPLGPEDVPPHSAVSTDGKNWSLIWSVDEDGIVIGSHGFTSFVDLFECRGNNWLINYPSDRTAAGFPTVWRKCEKGEVQP